MRLSSKALYALRALYDVARYGDDGPVQLKDIAEREKIPIRFLEQIFGDLKRFGFVRSKRGPGGGYTLLMTPSECTVAAVLRAVGELPRMPEAAGREGEDPLPVDLECEELLQKVIMLLTECTVQDMMVRAGQG